MGDALNAATDEEAPRILIVIENLPLARDRRVRRQSEALIEAGFHVSVICPRDDRAGGEAIVRGVRVYEYRPPPEGSSKITFIYEYAYSWIATAFLAFKALVSEGFDALQACNPPDTYFALGAPLRLFGKRFVFDQHDLAPELYAWRYGRRRTLMLTMLEMLEHASYRTADHVLATNESFRERALTRGRKRPGAVTVVRNGPDLSTAAAVVARPSLKAGKEFLCCWVGTMGPRDGIDLALQAIHELVYDRRRRDCRFVFVGAGESFQESRRLSTELDLDHYVDFEGWLPEREVFEYLATADVGLEPNLRTDLSTSMKTMEYMTVGLPIVAFDLKETRVSAQDAAAYAPRGDTSAFAALIDGLLDDPKRRAEMGERGRRRVEESLSWNRQKRAYVEVYRRLLVVPAADGDAGDVAGRVRRE